MRKIALIIIAVLTLGLLAGCGKTPAEQAAKADGEAAGSEAAGGVDLSGLKTLGDAFALEGVDEETTQRASYENKYVYAFELNGTLCRVIADLPSDVFDKILALEYDENYDQNEMELVSGLEISKAEDLSGQKLSQEELDALVGKTGQELFDAGWQSGSFSNTETLEFWLEYGPYSYVMHFDGEIKPEEDEDLDVYEALADKKVLDAKYEGIGDATIIEEVEETVE